MLSNVGFKLGAKLQSLVLYTMPVIDSLDKLGTLGALYDFALINVPTTIKLHQILRKTSEPLVPPKPKLLLSATSIFIWRAVFAQ